MAKPLHHYLAGQGSHANLPGLVVTPVPTPGHGLAVGVSGALDEAVPGVASPGAGVATTYPNNAAVPMSAVASTAKLMLVNVPTTLTVTTFNYRQEAQSGNVDFGIYDASFHLLWSRGSIACPATGTTMILISDSGGGDTLTLAGGSYFLAVVADNITAAVRGFNAGAQGNLSGIAYTCASAFPLPGPAPSPTSYTTGSALPGLGIFA